MITRKTTLLSVIILLYATCTQGQKVRINVSEIRSTVQKWSDAHNRNDTKTFSILYTSQVTFYTRKTSKEECIKIKSKLLSSDKYFHQEIIGDPMISVYESGIVRCDFTKRVQTGSTTKEYKSYLLLRPNRNDYRIAEESDLITDSRLAYSPNHGRKLDRSSLEIIESPSVKEKAGQTETEVRLMEGNFVRSLIILIGVFLLMTIGIAYWLSKRKKVKNTLMERQNKSKQQTDSEFKKKKGDDFEAYIFDKFSPKYFEVIYWQSDNMYNGKYPASNNFPDMELNFNYKGFFRKFAVECKFRKELFNDGFEISSSQLDHYNQFKKERKMDVYIVLGLHGQPLDPEELYLIPLSSFDGTNYISRHDLNKYRRSRSNFFYNQNLDILQ